MKMTLKLAENEQEKEHTFKKNVDYFEMADGTYYTVDALMQKYDIARSTLYNKAKENRLDIIKIANLPCFKDDPTIFSKKDKQRIANLEGHKLISYAELVRKIETVLDDLEEQRKQLIDKESEHRKDTGRIVDSVEKNTGMLVEYVKEIKRNNSLLEDLMNYITKQGINQNE